MPNFNFRSEDARFFPHVQSVPNPFHPFLLPAVCERLGSKLYEKPEGLQPGQNHDLLQLVQCDRQHVDFLRG